MKCGILYFSLKWVSSRLKCSGPAAHLFVDPILDIWDVAEERSPYRKTQQRRSRERKMMDAAGFGGTQHLTAGLEDIQTLPHRSSCS